MLGYRPKLQMTDNSGDNHLNGTMIIFLPFTASISAAGLDVSQSFFALSEASCLQSIRVEMLQFLHNLCYRYMMA